MTRSRALALGFALLAALLIAGGSLLAARASRSREVERLAALLPLREGITVAEIGAGRGWLTVEIARRLGPSGRVYSTELDPARLDDIRQAVAEAGLTNVTVLEAAEQATNLPPGCCEAIFMRRVYHHLRYPRSILASLRVALKPGGRLVIIEFRRSGLLGRVTGMGIDPPDLLAAVTSAGFRSAMTTEWPGWDHYVTVFANP